VVVPYNYSWAVLLASCMRGEFFFALLPRLRIRMLVNHGICTLFYDPLISWHCIHCFQHYIMDSNPSRIFWVPRLLLCVPQWLYAFLACNRSTGFFFPNLGGGWVGIHPQEDLARFGYTSDRTVEKFYFHAIVWRHATSYCLNMATSKRFSSQCGDAGPFFPKKSLCTCRKPPFICRWGAKFREENSLNRIEVGVFGRIRNWVSRFSSQSSVFLVRVFFLFECKIQAHVQVIRLNLWFFLQLLLLWTIIYSIDANEFWLALFEQQQLVECQGACCRP
jgi:hypothetical protein